MTEPELPDEQLLAELRGLFSRAEPVPGWVVESAKAAYDLRLLDVELALLIWDSDVDAPAVAVRADTDVLDPATQPRALSFECDDLAVEIEIGPASVGRPLIGQLVPPQPARIEVHQLPGSAPAAAPQVTAPVSQQKVARQKVARQEVARQEVEADAQGRFTVPALVAGLVRISCRRPGRRAVATDWVRLD